MISFGQAFRRMIAVVAAGLICSAFFTEHSSAVQTGQGTESAPDAGSVKIRVIDNATKQPMPAATVRVMGTERGATTDENGLAVIKGLREGLYKLQASYVGYATSLVTDIRIVRDKTASAEIAMAEEAVQAGEVTVVASMSELSADAPVSKFSYSGEEIYKSPGAAGDIFRAIETLPGVSSGGGEFSAFSVRGGSPRDNITLVDNIPVDNISHFDGGTEEQEKMGGRFSIFTPRLITQADFQAGGFPARYGGKSSSIIDLKIREGNRDDITLNASYDLLGGELNYDGPSFLLPTTGVVVSARHQDFEQVLGLIGQEDLGNPSYTDLILKTTSDIDQDNKLNILGILSDEQFVRNIDHVYESDSLYATELATLDEQKYIAGADWRLLTGSSSFLRATGYYKEIRRDLLFGRAYTDPVSGTPPPKDQAPRREDVIDQRIRERELGLKTMFHAGLADGVSASAGLDVMRTSFDFSLTQNGLDTLYVYDRDDFRPDTNQRYLLRESQYVDALYDQEHFNAAGFAELSLGLNGVLTVNPGLRYEYYGFSGKGYLAPRLSASYGLSQKTRINAAGGVYFQPPQLKIVGEDAANQSLSNEKAYHVIGGFTHLPGEDFKITVEGYYKQFDDMLVRRDRTTNVWTNEGDGWGAGIDVSLVRRFVDNLYGQVNYSYAQSKRNDNDGRGRYDGDFEQPHMFNILAGYELDHEWSFSAKWKFATGRPKDSYVVRGDVFADPDFLRYSKEITTRNTGRLKDFHTLNVRVDFRKQFGRVALVSYIDVLNVYNRLNVNEERFLERSGGVDLKGFRMVPTLGLKLEI